MPVRKIVLFSDGTGNSAGKITKTNVWRLYQAIDLTEPETLAFHDDGVGTGGFKLMRVLGGALGIGLARNVRELYTHFCRHYDGPDCEVSLCGFSRGAFTVRVLSGLIDKFGVIDRNSGRTIQIRRWHRMSAREVSLATDEGLAATVHLAYKTIRRESSRALLWRVADSVRNLFRAAPLDCATFRKTYCVDHDVRIKFLGVFDTVSAYGLPFDEMSIVIHKYLFPLRFPDMNLSKKVDNAVQALAVDEARHTFHPVLWTEWPWDKDKKENVHDPRPEQVWFPGVHSDIGGGYADERLSLVPALWMAEMLERRAGVKLRNTVISDLRERADDLGDLHKSRSGFSAFYRFKPRIFDKLGNEDLDGNGYAEVQVRRFKIHESVLERIRKTGADYAPLGIPETYDVVRSTGGEGGQAVHEIVSAEDAGFEDSDQRNRRVQALRSVAQLIFWRQLLYYVMIGIVLTGVILPLLWLTDRANIPSGPLAHAADFLAKGFAFLPLPETERIGLFWVQHAEGFWGLFAAFWVAYFVSAGLSRATQGQAQKAWAHVAGGSAPEAPSKGSWIDVWRDETSRPYRLYKWWTKKFFPLLMVIALVVVLPLVPILRWYLFTPLDGKSICATVQPEATQQMVLETTDPCLNTGIELKEGRTYTISIKITEDWRDGRQARANGEGTGLPAGPQGLGWANLTWKERATMTSLALGRRYWSEDWMALMGSIGRERDHAFRINATPVEGSETEFEYTFHAWRSDILYLFVNDGINVRADDKLCQTGYFEKERPWACYYNNNQGRAEISIRTAD